MKIPLLSVISPVYRGELLVQELVTQIISSVSSITQDFEIILVEDGSPDDSWKEIERAALTDKRVKGIKLSRNFGQHYAITAGLDAASGDWVIVMDCDLQDRPEEIPELYNKASEGYDIVLARREVRQDGFFKRLSSKAFYAVLSYLTGTRQDAAIANFGIYSRRAIDAINSMREPIRYFPTMVRWVGFQKATLNVVHAARESGKSTYNLRRLLNLALDIILAYSDKPIRLTIKFGFSVAVFSFLFGIITIIRYLLGDIKVMGYTSMLISIWFFCGIILTVLGIIGLYLGKTFEGVKQRPIYITQKTVNLANGHTTLSYDRERVQRTEAPGQ